MCCSFLVFIVLVANLVLKISEITAFFKYMSKNSGVVSIVSKNVKVSVKETKEDKWWKSVEDLKSDIRL